MTCDTGNPRISVGRVGRGGVYEGWDGDGVGELPFRQGRGDGGIDPQGSVGRDGGLVMSM